MKRCIGIFILLLSACGPAESIPIDSAGEVAAQSIQSRQQLAASQTLVAQAQVAAVRATANHVATLDADARAAAATERAFSLAQRQAAATVTAQAVVFQSTVAAAEISSSLAARSAAATATADAMAQTVLVQRQAATATQSALSLAIQSGIDDAVRTQAQAQFYDMAARLSVGAFIVMMLCFGFYFAQRGASEWLTTSFLRRSIIQTAQGIVVFAGDRRNGYTPSLLPPADYRELSEVPAIVSADTIRVNANGKTVQMARDNPSDETVRRLALRLLRESAMLNGWTSNIIPSAKVLGWSDDTRARAIDAIRPHLVIKFGKGGGTRIAPRFATLHGLYAELAARKLETAS